MSRIALPLALLAFEIAAGVLGLFAFFASPFCGVSAALVTLSAVAAFATVEAGWRAAK